MKLVLAIVNHDDAHAVLHNLTQEGYPVTKLATTGGFLQVGNVTLIMGVEENKLDGAIEIIKKSSTSRKQIIPTAAETTAGFFAAMPVNVTVGGATVFVLDVDAFHKF